MPGNPVFLLSARVLVHWTSAMDVPPVQNLSRPDFVTLQAVQGWVMLGNLQEASIELDNISLPARELPEVLAVQSELHLRKQEWAKALEPTKRLYERRPDPEVLVNLAFCVRFLEGVEQSLALLTEGRKKHGEHWALAYNMACYQSVLGNHSEAHSLLDQALLHGDAKFILDAALHDADLEPLRESLLKRYMTYTKPR